MPGSSIGGITVTGANCLVYKNVQKHISTTKDVNALLKLGVTLLIPALISVSCFLIIIMSIRNEGITQNIYYGIASITAGSIIGKTIKIPNKDDEG